MTAIVEGRYVQGKIELLQAPVGWPDGPVRVMLIAQGSSRPAPVYLTLGKYPGGQSTLEDFRDAEWDGEREFDDQYGK